MIDYRRNCVIFERCKRLFPLLESGLKWSEVIDSTFEMVAKSKYESDLKVIKEYCEPLKGQFMVRLFVEFELNEQIFRHPSFFLELDYMNKRAEVLSFESNLFPPIRLDAYTEVEGVRYTNIVAKKDLETLCKNWLKQLNELNYKLQWEEKTQTA